MSDVVQIPLTKGMVALIDAQDYERVSQYQWWANKSKPTSKTWYATTKIIPPGEHWTKRKNTQLHRFILDAPPEIKVDHINRDGLDCRRHNLRMATNSQNVANVGPLQIGTKTSQFKGVHLTVRVKIPKWESRIMCQGKDYYLGVFDSEIDAAMAYDRKAKELFGDFAHLNFPSTQP